MKRVAHNTALGARFNVASCAICGFVAHFVALEAKFFGAFVRVVVILAAQNARNALAVIRTLARDVSKLLAVAALDRGIRIGVVASLLRFHPLVVVLFGRVFFGRREIRLGRTIRFAFFALNCGALPVLIAFQRGCPRHQQVRIPPRVEGRNVRSQIRLADTRTAWPSRSARRILRLQLLLGVVSGATRVHNK